MTRAPRPPNSLSDVLRWAGEMYTYLQERESPTEMPNTLLNRTGRGTARSAFGDRGGGKSKPTSLQWKGQYDDAVDYKKGDIVWVPDPYTGDDNDIKFETCAFVALEDVAAGGGAPHPLDGVGQEEDVSSSSSWDIFPNPMTGTLILASGNSRIIADATGIPGGTAFATIDIAVDRTTPGSGRILLDSGLCLTKILYPQAVTFKNSSDVNETRYFICSNPEP